MIAEANDTSRTIARSFLQDALAFKSQVETALAKIEDFETVKEMLDKGDALQRYTQRLKVGVEIARPIAISVLKIKAKLGELMPRGNVGAGRGNKNGKAALPFSRPTVQAFRKIADNQDRLGVSTIFDNSTFGPRVWGMRPARGRFAMRERGSSASTIDARIFILTHYPQPCPPNIRSTRTRVMCRILLRDRVLPETPNHSK